MGRALERLWYPDGSPGGHRLLRAVTSPLSWAYRAGLGARPGPRPEKAGRPVIAVGNLTAGGSGKTPLVIELVTSLLRKGVRVAVLSRGYGRRTRGLRVVNPPAGEWGAPEEVGDEPMLIARRCPEAVVVVGNDRVAAGRYAVRRFSPDVLVCDDAFQHRRLHRDLDLLAVHAVLGFGNGHLLPRGPLREPVEQVRRAGLVVFTHAQQGDTVAALRRRHWIPEIIPAAHCMFSPNGWVQGPGLEPVDLPRDTPVLAACGVAHPRGFFESCRQAGLELRGTRSFGDHRRWSPGAVARLRAEAARAGAEAVVVTEKDLVRMPQHGEGPGVVALRLDARWPDTAGLALVEMAIGEVAASVDQEGESRNA